MVHKGKYDTKRNNNLDCIKIKNFCSPKDSIKKIKTNHNLLENICKSMSNKGFIPKIYKECLQFNKSNNSIKKWTKGKRKKFFKCTKVLIAISTRRYLSD